VVAAQADDGQRGHWKTSTFLAALRQDGVTAPFVFAGPINGEIVRLYVE